MGSRGDRACEWPPCSWSCSLGQLSSLVASEINSWRELHSSRTANSSLRDSFKLRSNTSKYIKNPFHFGGETLVRGTGQGVLFPDHGSPLSGSARQEADNERHLSLVGLVSVGLEAKHKGTLKEEASTGTQFSTVSLRRRYVGFPGQSSRG